MADVVQKSPVLCEYFIQNDHDLSDPYVNMYILPKKYADISDV